MRRIEEGGRSLNRRPPACSCVQQKHSYLLPIPGHCQLNLISQDMQDYAGTEAHLSPTRPC
jgi:hypothetical protein